MHGYNPWLQPVVTTRGYNPWLQPVVTIRSCTTHILSKIHFFMIFLHLLPFLTYFLCPKNVKNYPVLFSWIIPFHRHPTRHILKILIFGGFLAGFGGFSGVPLVNFFLYKLDLPRIIMGYCATFQDPSYLRTPSK